MTVAADQVLVEIPARRFQRPFGRPPICRTDAGSAPSTWTLAASGKPTAYSPCAVCLMSSAVPGSWPPKSFDGTPMIIRPRCVIARPQLLQAGILRGVSAKRGGVDDEDRLAGVVGELDVAAIQSGEGKRISGDAAHGLGTRDGRHRERAGDEGEKASAVGEHDVSSLRKVSKDLGATRVTSPCGRKCAPTGRRRHSHAPVCQNLPAGRADSRPVGLQATGDTHYVWQTVCSLSVRMWLVHAMRRARVASDGPAPSLTHKGRAMQQNIRVFVGLDTSKMKISVALAEEGRQGEVRFLGDIDNTPDAMKRLVNKLTGKYQQLLFCYEAGPTGYGLHRQITALGHDCSVIAPSLIPKRPGEHVKTNRRDALTLARLHRAGELTTIWVPDPGHEAIRDLVRAREAAMEDLREKRQHLQSFLLRHGRIYPGLRSWTLVHARWLSNLTFEHPAQYLVLREYRQAIEDAEARLERLTQQVADVVSTWSMAPVVEAYQAMRGVAFLTAVTFVAEIGDVRRFETPRQLMAYLGLVPSERSTGEQVRRGGITKAGNPRARRVLIEGAWTYRYPARLSRPLQVRQESLPKIVRAIAWKAQVRLCARYRRLMAAGKRQTLITTAIAREMAAFLWAIGQEVQPRSAA